MCEGAINGISFRLEAIYEALLILYLALLRSWLARFAFLYGLAWCRVSLGGHGSAVSITTSRGLDICRSATIAGGSWSFSGEDAGVRSAWPPQDGPPDTFIASNLWLNNDGSVT